MSQTPFRSNGMSGGRRGRDPVAIRITFARSLRCSSVIARDRYAAVAVEPRRSLDVVDVILRDVLRRHLLQQIADVPRSFADRVRGDFRRRRDP